MQPDQQKKSSSLPVMVALLLVVIIAIAGYLYWNTAKTPSAGPSLSTENSEESRVSFEFPVLTQDERNALNGPKSASAPMKEVEAQAEAAHKAAVPGTTIAIGRECRVSPVVLKIENGKTLTFKNYDALPHTIAFDASHVVNLSGAGTATIKIDFGEKDHIYGYGCDMSSGAIGLILIAE